MPESGVDADQTNQSDGSDGRPVAAIALAGATVAVPLAVVGALVFAVLPGPFWVGIVLGLLVAAAVIWLWLRAADRVAMARIDGGLPDSADVERLTNLVSGLALAAGVAEPEVRVLPDPARNALVAARSGRNHLAVTTGLLDHIDPIQMEGLVAELLIRLKNGDAEAATIGAALFGRPMLDGPLAPLLRPLATRGLDLLLDPDRDLTADRHAVSLTRYPPGLLAALQIISQGELRPSASTDGVAHMWLVDPVDGAGSSSSRSGIDLRIDVLAEY